MARIPEEELERLKREVSLLDRVRAAGIELQRHGANWLGRCPFHEDHTPSLVITPAKNLWHCLGACQAGGSVIDWEMRRHGCSFRHAAERLRAELRGGIPGGAEASPGVLQLDPAWDDGRLLTAVAGFYHQALLQSPEALAYLAKRGLEDRAAIDTFQLGYANRTLAYQLPSKALKAGAAIRGRLQQLGLLRASGHEHFTGSLVVPIHDVAGQVVGLYGRKIRDDLREGTPMHLYLPRPHRGVWNVGALANSTEIILCEALLDALTFWVAGFRHVTASYGVRGFTEAHRAALRDHRVERVLLAYDRDEAGDTAATAAAQELLAQGIGCYRIQFPLGMDANAYALKAPPAAESLGHLIRHAVWLGSGPPPSRTAEQVTQGVEGPAPASVAAHAALPSSLSVESEAALVSPEAPPAPAALVVETTAHEHRVAIGDRHYRIRGLATNRGPETLRVTLIGRRGEGLVADTLDCYAANARTRYAQQAATALGVPAEVVTADLGQLLLALEGLRDQLLAAKAATPSDAPIRPAPPPMTVSEREAALALLRDPELLTRIQQDFARAGLVGEATNALIGYLATLSRKLPRPLAVLIQSASAAGKTSLMDALLAFVPPEDRVHYAALTGQALYYLGETDLQHKVLSLVEEEGAERATYALKLLQSEGELTIASTGKDPQTGKLVTHSYRVQGPVQLLLTTTAHQLDEEFANRALVLTVDESPAQTRAIQVRQRAARTLEGLLARTEREALVTLHQHAQRLLEPLAVVNPFAPELRFLDGRTRTRRDHEKYLTLIDAMALLHQHQREVKTITRRGTVLRYVEVTAADLAAANQLAAPVLTRSLDELPPQTRRFVGLLDAWITTECQARRLGREAFRFLARDARAVTGLGATQVKLHLHRLVELEYVLVHRAPRGQGVSYELLVEGAAPPAEGEQMAALLGYDPERPAFAGRGRSSVGDRSGGSRTLRTAGNPPSRQDFAPEWSDSAGKHLNGRRPPAPVR
jgi:DNA primase catalytic core